MSDQLQVRLEGAEKMLSTMMAPILAEATRGKSPAEAAAINLTLAPLLTAIRDLTETPVLLRLDWPSGVPTDIRTTLRAQLQAELEEATRLRIRQEYMAIIRILPALGQNMVQWFQTLAAEAQQEATQ